jgi:hypothetical protein
MPFAVLKIDPDNLPHLTKKITTTTRRIILPRKGSIKHSVADSDMIELSELTI